MIIAPLHTATKVLMNTLDTDTEALNAYLTVQKMSETNDEEKRLLVLIKIETKKKNFLFYFILVNK